MQHQEEAITPVQEKSVDEILLREEPEVREFTQDEMTETKRKLEWSEHSFEKAKESEEQEKPKLKQLEKGPTFSMDEREASEDEYQPSFITEEPGVDRGHQDEYITESERQRREELFQSLEGTSIRLRQEAGLQSSQESDLHSTQMILSNYLNRKVKRPT